jgi:hypothetical protein
MKEGVYPPGIVGGNGPLDQTAPRASRGWVKGCQGLSGASRWARRQRAVWMT